MLKMSSLKVLSGYFQFVTLGCGKLPRVSYFSDRIMFFFSSSLFFAFDFIILGVYIPLLDPHTLHHHYVI